MPFNKKAHWLNVNELFVFADIKIPLVFVRPPHQITAAWFVFDLH